eukprot:c9421_g1_i1.p1 GENE.c9421_g1_i1~~c9421_g1_i1.p1  ORF type:complete len:499 (-),score=121.94 c9421_g1_i1:84-1580(-)
MDTVGVVGLMLLCFLGFLLFILICAFIYQVFDNSRGGSFTVSGKMKAAYAEIEPLKKAPRELWIVYVLKLLESYGYFSMSLILTLYLSEEFGYDDVDAGLIYGVFGMLVSVYGIFVGFVIDNFGVQRSLILGHILLVAGRILLGIAKSQTVLLLVLFIIIPMGMCFGIPVMMTGIRRYTDSSNRTAAFGLFYQVMNVAALIAGPTVDTLREVIPKDPTGNTLSSYRVVILSGAVATALGLVIVLLFVREVEASDDGEVKEFTPLKGSPMEIAKEIISEERFWRFMLFITFLIGVKMVFRHLDATFPKWMTRSFGEEVAFGTIYAINPFLVIVLVPVVASYSKDVNALLVITIGAWLSAVSVFLLVWKSIIAAILFVVLLSVGESIWSPRLYEYTTMIAPKGREGTYASLSSAPYFVAKLGVGYIGGVLLESYCPAAPCDRGWIMWLIVGVTTVIGPIGILACYGYIGGSDLKSEGSRIDEETAPFLDPSPHAKAQVAQ